MDITNNILYNLIDDILWKEWDPIGVNDVTTARNEYQCYTSIIYNLKLAKSGKKIIANSLYKIETETMGLSGNIKRCLKIAGIIISV